MNSVFLEKLVLSGKHGVSEEERARIQEFFVDISADVDTAPLSKSDEISDTVNYKDFSKIAREVVEGPSCRLLETLAHRIAKKVLANNKVKSVSVTIRKPKAVPNGMAGVTVALPD